MQVSAPTRWNVLSSFDEQDLSSERKWSLYLFCWTNQELVFDFDTRVNATQFFFIGFKIKMKLKAKTGRIKIYMTIFKQL